MTTAPSAALGPTSAPQTNILHALSPFSTLVIPANASNLHALAPPSQQQQQHQANTLNLVSNLVDLIPRLSYSLNAGLGYPVNDQRVLTLYKESAMHEHESAKVRFSTFSISLFHDRTFLCLLSNLIDTQPSSLSLSYTGSSNRISSLQPPPRITYLLPFLLINTLLPNSNSN